MKQKKFIYLLFACLAFAGIIFLRVWKLNEVPVSLFGDEIDVGLQAYSIAETGKDYFGNKLPVLFHSFSEYRLPMLLYLDAPFIKIFGLNEWGVRTPPFILGLVSIVAIYFLAKEFFDKKVALVAAVFLAISPWHLIFSRQANDAGILLPFVLFGTLFFIKGLKDFKLLIPSSIFFCLGIYAYAIASLFIPLFVIFLTILFRKKIFGYGLKKLTLLFLVTLAILLPYIVQSINGRTTQRFSYVSVAPKKEIVAEVEARRQWSDSSLSRIFNNKMTTVTERIFKNYSKSWSLSFLFSEGDTNPRQSVDGHGLFYLFDVLLIIIALWTTVSNFSRFTEDKKKIILILALWLIFAPIPSALTQGGGNHASRLILMLPPLIIFSALGFKTLLKLGYDLKGKLFVGVLALYMLFEISTFFHSYFVIWPRESWRWWQYGFKEVGSYLKDNAGNYQRVFLNNTYEPMLPRFLFWYAYDIKLFQREFADDKHIESIYPGFNGFKLGDKFYFGEIVKPIENLAEDGNLIVASSEKDVSNPYIFDNPKLNLLDVIHAPDQTTIFYIYSKGE